MNKHCVGLLAVTLTSVAALTAANAADLAVKAPVYKAPVIIPFSWTGFYIGANGGGAWGTTDWTYVVNGSGTANHNTSGGLAGGTAGYNWQFAPNWVIGIEGDFDWADIKGSTACPNPAFSCQSKISDFATLRGRFGYAFDRFLVYGTGGAAWGNDQIQTALPGATFGTTGTRTGYAAGAGVEWAFSGPWSAKVEYLHYDLGSATTTVDNGLLVSSREKGDLVRAGVNWKFWP
jgi:outer membrane immunogenic protein